MNYFDRLHYDQETGALTWNMPSSAQANNHSCGLRGVTWNKQHRRWQSKLMANKVVYHVGYFRTPEEAHEAYMRLKARLHLGGRSH